MSALADLHLLRPGWLLIAVPALWLIWRNKQSQAAGSQWARACDPALLDAMLQQPGQTSRWPMWLASAAALIGAIALAGPTWQRLPTPVLQSEAATVIVLDLSKSMDATDLEPSRLSRARFAALDVLAALPEGRVGVVSFAGSAFTVVPLTDDRETAKHLITSLDTDVMPIQGSRIGTGLGKAHDLLRNAAASNGRVVLLTDSAPDRAARRRAIPQLAGSRLAGYGATMAGARPKQSQQPRRPDHRPLAGRRTMVGVVAVAAMRAHGPAWLAGSDRAGFGLFGSQRHALTKLRC